MALIAAGISIVPPAATAQLECGGAAVTVDFALGQLPTDGDDVIRGTAGDDLIAAGAGNDIVCGVGGNDTIWGQSGNDVISGGSGDDKLRGGDGDDKLSGGSGVDDLSGGRGDDQVHGDSGDDRKVRGGTGDDVVDGGDGADAVVAGNGGYDVVTGGAGDDALVTGGPRPDTVSGGPGDDLVKGNKGADTLSGDGGDDSLLGGPQRDFLDGGAGTDVCNGGTQDDAAANCETTLNVLESAVDLFTFVGVVRVNRDAPATGSLAVQVSASAYGGTDPTEMRVANGTDPSTAPWQPFAAEFAWTLDGANSNPVVSIQLRDGDGGLSPVVSDTIRYVADGIAITSVPVDIRFTDDSQTALIVETQQATQVELVISDAEGTERRVEMTEIGPQRFVWVIPAGTDSFEYTVVARSAGGAVATAPEVGAYRATKAVDLDSPAVTLVLTTTTTGTDGVSHSEETVTQFNPAHGGLSFESGGFQVGVVDGQAIAYDRGDDVFVDLGPIEMSTGISDTATISEVSVNGNAAPGTTSYDLTYTTPGPDGGTTEASGSIDINDDGSVRGFDFTTEGSATQPPSRTEGQSSPAGVEPDSVEPGPGDTMVVPDDDQPPSSSQECADAKKKEEEAAWDALADIADFVANEVQSLVEDVVINAGVGTAIGLGATAALAAGVSAAAVASGVAAATGVAALVRAVRGVAGLASFVRDASDVAEGIAEAQEAADNASSACEPPEDAPQEPPSPGGTYGHPNLITFDRVRYTFHGAGDYVLAESTVDDDFRVHVRYARLNDMTDVSFNRAVAAQVGSSVVSIGDDAALPAFGPATVRIDDVEVNPDAGAISLPDGAVLTATAELMTVTWSDGSALDVGRRVGDPFQLTIAPSRYGAMRGMMGDADSDPLNDIVTPEGVVVDPFEFDDFYAQFGAGWLLTPEESMFESELQLRDILPIVPGAQLTLADLPADARANAEMVCRDAGITGGTGLSECIFDVAMTNDGRWTTGILALGDLISDSISAAAFSDRIETTLSIQSGVHEGQLEDIFVIDDHVLDLQAGDSIQIDVTECPEDESFEMVLISPSDRVVSRTQGDDCGAFAISNLMETGEYHLFAYDTAGFTGAYSFGFIFIYPQAEQVEIGAVADVTLAAADDVWFGAFDLDAGDVFYLADVWSTGSGGTWNLLSPYGLALTDLQGGLGNADALARRVIAPETGTYYLRWISYTDGPSTLTVLIQPETEPIPIDYDRPVDISLSRLETWFGTFTAGPGEVYITSTGAPHHLYVTGSDGQSLAHWDPEATREDQVRLDLPNNDTYTIHLQRLNNDHADYTVEVSTSPALSR